MLVSLVPGVLGCADDVVVSDASPDAPADAMIDVSLVIPPVTPPALPEPVDGGPCPSGWETMDLGRATVCRPWDDDGPGCADGEVRFPGDDGCQVLGESSCSAGGFPTDVTGPVIYVEAGATSGDGSMDTPFGTIGEAVVVATSGDTVAIAGGTYAEEVTLPDGVSLRGACASTTIIEGADGPLSSAVVTAGEGSAVSDLTLRGGRPGLRIDGVAASAARLRVEATHLGIPVINGGSLDAEEIAVVGTDGEPGAGLFLLNAARATVDRAFLEDNLSFGVGVGGEDSELVLRRAVIRRTRIAEGATLGVGIAVNGPATVTVEQSELSENRAGGFTAQDRAIATIRSTVIRDTAPAPDGLLGSGIIGSMGATITVEGSLLVRNTSAAVSLIGLQTALLARDVVFADTRSNGSGETTEAGVGIIIGDGSTADLRRAVVDGAAGLGISVSGLDSRLDARDLVVRNVAPRPVDLAAGRGIDVEREASAGLERLVVEDVRGSAILVVDLGSALALTDATLRRVLSDARTRASGRGLTLQFAGDFEATRLQIEETRDVGILAYGEDVYVRATDLAIDRTLPRECAVDTCADFRSGNGITASDGAQVEIESFRIADSTLVGLQLARGARIVASDGLVTRNAVGVNAQTEGFDPADVSRNVQFVDNGINFDGSALPIPQPGSR
jgi:hypothetical protein